MLAFLVLKVLSLIGSIAITAGFIGFFAFDSLQPYKWYLLIGGFIVVAAAELVSKRLARSTLQDEIDEIE